MRFVVITAFLVAWQANIALPQQVSQNNDAALQYFFNNPFFADFFESRGYDACFMFAIVAPELWRYNAIRDKAETLSLQVLYVEAGSEYGNFSIGRFQMKPDFAEYAEKYAATSKHLQQLFPEIIAYKAETEREIRRERMGRLSSEKWQCLYLALFYEIIADRFPDKKFVNTAEKLLFYASAYNYGLDADENKITAWIHQQAFPVSPSGRKTAYATIALEYYEKSKLTDACKL